MASFPFGTRCSSGSVHGSRARPQLRSTTSTGPPSGSSLLQCFVSTTNRHCMPQRATPSRNSPNSNAWVSRPGESTARPTTGSPSGSEAASSSCRRPTLTKGSSLLPPQITRVGTGRSRSAPEIDGTSSWRPSELISSAAAGKESGKSGRCLQWRSSSIGSPARRHPTGPDENRLVDAAVLYGHVGAAQLLEPPWASWRLRGTLS
jgi:hypothetical protein